MVDIFVLILKLENENRAVNNSPKFMWLPPGQRRETWVNRLPVHGLYCIIKLHLKAHITDLQKNEPLHHPKVKLIVLHP